MLRAGRFRHRLLDEAFLKEFSDQANLSLRPFLHLWKSGQLKDVEIVAIYIWIFSFLRRPTDFLGGPHQTSLHFSKDTIGLTGRQALDLLLPTLPSSLAQSKSLQRFNSDQNFLEVLGARSLRSLPFAVSRSLCQWKEGLYPLKLRTDIPTAEEVLLMQCDGYRCVSMLIEKAEIQNFVLEGRDVFGFLVHDLIHADHFFSDPLNAQAQIHFSQKLWVLYQLPLIQGMLQKDPQFVVEFQYLMADMNSVPLHLLKSLKAVLLGYYKRREGVAMNSPLDLRSEDEFQSSLKVLLQPWSFSQEAIQAALRLNTPKYRAPEDSLLLDAELRPKSPH